MELREMKKLESEVRDLQSLMHEVHKNQVELNNILLSRSLCSRSRIKLGDVEVAESSASAPPDALRAPRLQLQTGGRPKKEMPWISKCLSTTGFNQDFPVVKDFREDARQKEIQMNQKKKWSKDSSRNSYYIQNILREDCRAGGAVIDLFVTVKTATDSLEFLSKSNNEAFDKLNFIKRETIALGKGYKGLLDDMRQLLGKMSESVRLRRKLPAVDHLPGETNKAKGLPELQEGAEGEKDEQENLGASGAFATGRDPEPETVGSERVLLAEDGAESKRGGGKGSGGGGGCIGCFVSAHKATLFEEMPELSEATLAAFMENLFWTQRGKRSVCEACKSSSLVASLLQKGESEEKLNLGESAFRMFCEFCKILNEAAREEPGSDEDLTVSVKSVPERPTFYLYASADCPPNFWGYRRKALRSASSEKSSAEITESQTELEEAAPDNAIPGTRSGLKAKPSVTCMGDLTRAVAGKKSASTLTTANNILPCRKLSNGIKLKMKRIRSKKSVKAEEQRAGRSPKRLSWKPEHKVNAEKDERATNSDSGSRPLRRVLVSGTSGSFPPGFEGLTGPSRFSGSDGTCRGEPVCAADEDYESDQDSFHNCYSDSVPEESRSGDEDLEEFADVFNGTARTTEDDAEPGDGAATRRDDSRPRPQEVGSSDSSSSYLGFLHWSAVKMKKALFFEIQKCYPAQFVLEIWQKTVQYSKDSSDDDSTSGESHQGRVVVGESTSEFVIFLELEMEDGKSVCSRELILEHQASCLLSQTPGPSFGNAPPFEERVAGPAGEDDDDDDDGQSLYDAWEECHQGELEEERITFDEPAETRSDGRAEKKKEGKVKRGTADVLIVKNAKQRADVWLVQKSGQRMYLAVGREASAVVPEVFETVDTKPAELEKALNLIREIESDVADVKLSDAISILPRLELELRKHLRSKMKSFEEKEGGAEAENFFPSENFWPEVEPSETENVDASERMQNLLLMLTELETAIRSNECAVGARLCRYDSSKVHKLLRALAFSIRELEDDASVSNLSQTLDIASRLDTAVREYDSVVKKRSLECLRSERGGNWGQDAESLEPIHLKNVRKKVFEVVEDEVSHLDRRVELGFLRLNLLEKENDEAMTFLETFLQKTKKRISELTSLKSEVRMLSASLRDLHDILIEKVKQKHPPKKETEPESQQVESKDAPVSVVAQAFRDPQHLQVPEIPQGSQTLHVPQISQVPQTLQSREPEIPQVPQTLQSPEPEIPQVPQTLHVPEIPQVPQTLHVPEIPQVPQALHVPEVPQVPQALQVPEIPQVSQHVQVPQTLPVPEAPQVSQHPRAPEIPQVSQHPRVPEIPQVSQQPQVPQFSQSLQISEGPQITRNSQASPVVEVIQVVQSYSETGNPGADSGGANPRESCLRETVSGLLSALDDLKSRAREKNELCREILSSAPSEKARESSNSSRRSSRSSFTAKHSDTLTSSLIDFRKIGESSLYLEWSSPKGSLKDFVTGYEIYINGKLNQKVRNPRRLQAVLYAIEFVGITHLELYAIAENYPKILLITRDYQED